MLFFEAFKAQSSSSETGEQLKTTIFTFYPWEESRLKDEFRTLPTFLLGSFSILWSGCLINYLLPVSSQDLAYFLNAFPIRMACAAQGDQRLGKKMGLCILPQQNTGPIFTGCVCVCLSQICVTSDLFWTWRHKRLRVILFNLCQHSYVTHYPHKLALFTLSCHVVPKYCRYISNASLEIQRCKFWRMAHPGDPAGFSRLGARSAAAAAKYKVDASPLFNKMRRVCGFF